MQVLQSPLFWQYVGGVLGATGVLAGALGSHALPSRLRALKIDDQEAKDKAAKQWSIASNYYLMHAVALVAGAPALRRPVPICAGWAVGTILFSGSIYAGAWMQDKKYSRMAPVGGMLMMAAWGAIAFL